MTGTGRLARRSSRPSLRISLAAFLGACLLAPASGPALAQEPLEPALPCRAVGTGGTLEQSGPGLGCLMPTTEVLNPFTGTAQTVFTFDDADGDGALDLLGVSWGRTSLTAGQAESLRNDPGVISSGRLSRAAREGAFYYLRLAYAGGAADAGLHVATDADGKVTNNVPSSIARPDSPLAGSQIVISWFPGTRQAFSSNLASGGFYKASVPFLVIDDGAAAHLLLPQNRMGKDFVAAAFTPEEGWDRTDAVFRGILPVDGRIDVVVGCGTGYARRSELVVERLAVDGQTFRDLALPLHRHGRVVFRVAPSVAESLRAFIADRVADASGGASIPVSISLDEQGTRSRQGGTASILLVDDGGLGLVYEAGLTQQGYHVITGFDFEPTGDPVVDAVLAQAVGALLRYLPPSRVEGKAGLIFGLPGEACLPAADTPEG